MRKITQILNKFTGKQLKGGIAMDGLGDDLTAIEQAFSNVGLSIDNNVSRAAMDEYIAMNTTATVSSWVQFFQFFYPKAIFAATRARKADDVGGAYKAGDWKDEEVVFLIVERLGQPRPYSDVGNIPVSSWNPNLEKRQVVRFELGVRVGALEEAKSSAMRFNSTDLKRTAASEGLALAKNDVYFNGFQGNTYGILNDPNLSAYQTVAVGAGGNTEWLSSLGNKTFEEIIGDINEAFTQLATNLEGHIDSLDAKVTLVIPTAVLGALNIPNAYGKSVREYLAETYKNMDIIAVPNFNAANGAENVFYIMLEDFNGNFVQGQFYQEAFRLVGMQRLAKGFEESFANATAGCFVGQPLAIVRRTGI